MIKPKRLQPGDRIALVAPTLAVTPQTLAQPIRTLEELGFSVAQPPHLYADTWGYAATVEERLADFHAMVADEEVKLLLFDGGEVCNELLPGLDYDLLGRCPKILCSYSDSTTLLNAVTSRSGLVTFYGPSPHTFARLSEYNWQSFVRQLMEPEREFLPGSDWRSLQGGCGEGTLVGGYHVNFAALLQGDYFSFDPAGSYLLFLEAHERFSRPSVVAKWLAHIEQSGFLDCVTGLLWGHYSKSEQPLIEEILQRLGKRRSIPVVCCEDFGHGRNHAVLPIGVRARLDADACRLTFLESSVL